MTGGRTRSGVSQSAAHRAQLTDFRVELDRFGGEQLPVDVEAPIR